MIFWTVTLRCLKLKSKSAETFVFCARTTAGRSSFEVLKKRPSSASINSRARRASRGLAAGDGNVNMERHWNFTGAWRSQYPAMHLPGCLTLTHSHVGAMMMIVL